MNRTILRRPHIAILALVILSLACNSQVTVYETPAQPNVETAVAETLVVLTENAPTVTHTSMPTTLVPPTEMPQEFGEVYVYTVVENVNLRTNPGTLFTVSRVMPQNTRLLLLGQAPGGEWLNVMNEEEVAGWVNKNVVQEFYDGLQPPVIEPKDVVLVTGRVITELGTPVSGIGFAVTQATRRTDAMTDAEGRFYAYLPPNLNGAWTVSYISVSCTSNTMDINCNCIGNYCGSAHPESATVELPQAEPLSFVWK